MHFSRFIRLRSTFRSMSSVSIADLKRISAQNLSEVLLKEQGREASEVAIVDVRDDDFIGGHIKGCFHSPSRNLDVMMPTLVRRLEDKKTVVFHCALSQVRGPSAALQYLRERRQILQRIKGASSTAAAEEEGATPSADGQVVLVLDRGFVGWQELYGEDERLTEGYSKELWAEGF